VRYNFIPVVVGCELKGDASHSEALLR